VQRRDLDRLVGQERRQDPRQPPGEHGLSCARRAHHQQVVPPCRGDLEGAPRSRLPAHVAQIRSVPQRARRGRLGRRGRRERRAPAQVLEDLLEARRDQDLDAWDDGGLGAIAMGDDRAPVSEALRLDDRGQHSTHRTNGAGERELTDPHRACERLGGHPAERCRNGDGHREIERAADLSDVRRGERDGEDVLVEVDPEIPEGGSNSHARLPHAGLGEAY
jgi:hypothetical protein